MTMTGKAVRAKVLRRATKSAGRTMCRILPMVRGHLEVAHILGRLHARREVPDPVRENLRSAFGETHNPREMAEIARRFVEYSKRLYIQGILPHLRDFDDPDLWPVQGLEHLDGALAQNRGVILLTGHYGYARLIRPILRVHGYDVLLVVKPRSKVPERNTERESFVLRFARGQVGNLGPHDLPAGLDVRPIFQALADKRIVLALGDGLVAHAFLRLSLLDQPYPFPTGIIKIAMMSSAPVLPVFALDGDRRYPIRIEIQPPLPISSSADVATNLEEFARVLDRQVRDKPHLYNRWDREKWFQTALKRSERIGGKEHYMRAR